MVTRYVTVVITVTWYRVDDELMDSPKLLPLEDDWRLWCDSMALWLAAGVYCARAQTDGRIKRSRLVRLTPMPAARAIEVADALVDRARKDDSEFGLWEREGEDYRFHDWLHYQPSAEEIARAKEGNRQRQRRFRSSRRSKEQQVVSDDGNAASNALRNGGDNAVTNSVSNATPTRPDPTQISLTTFEREHIPTAGAVDVKGQPGLFAEIAKEPRKTGGVDRDTGPGENAAQAPAGGFTKATVIAELLHGTEDERRAAARTAEPTERQGQWGRELQRRRKAIGITADELAKFLSVSGRRISEWERGRREAGPEERDQCDGRLTQIEDRLAELAGAAVGALNRAAGTGYRESSQRAKEAALVAWRKGWEWPQMAAVVERICAELADYKNGEYLRPATVFQAKRLQDAAEQLDAGAVPHNGRQPLKGAALLDQMREVAADIRRDQEQRRRQLQ